MKKYKLIKDYPGLLEKGCVAELGLHGLSGKCYEVKGPNKNIYRFSKETIESNPEFWEEVVEKNYEILFYQSKDKIIAPATNFAIEISKPGYWDIHSVKRLSDGEVFTVGDKVSSTNNVYTGGLYNQNKISNNKAGKWANRFYDIPIKNFKFVNNKLCVFFDDPLNYGQPIEFINKVKQPLFTTEDGVDLFEGDKVYWQNPGTGNILHLTMRNLELSLTSNRKYFSTKEAAENHILMNKPCLSINDVYTLQTLIDTELIRSLKQVVKSKL